MSRVIGIDPGTVSVDLCGLDEGAVFLDSSQATADALADPAAFVALLESHAPLDLVAGPSGYGLPLVAARDLTDRDLRLAYLAAEGEAGGIGGLRTLMRALARSALPVVLTPGVVHLESVPSHRKVNRIDMGTADKVCAAALAIHDAAKRRGCRERDVSLILLELGGAFSAALAVDHGSIVDGLGGTSGPIGLRAAGALDGEVAFLAERVTKDLLFGGGAAAIAGAKAISADELAASTTPRGRRAWDAYVESAVKAIASLLVSTPGATEIVLSGRAAAAVAVHDAITRRLTTVMPRASVHVLTGFAQQAKQAAQGAALVADGLAGGAASALVDAMKIRGARGSAIDHLFVVSAETARAHLGIRDDT